MTCSLHEIDLMHMGVPGAISSWLARGPEGAVLIESGPASTLDALRAGLARHGLQPGDLDGVLLTHIHLDHAGGAWALASEGVPVWVHHLGAKHLIDPERLNRSSRRIFQERFDALWGALEPCPADMVHALHDGDLIQAGSLCFQAVETTGHANHHHAFHWLDTPDVCFAGDAAAMRVPGTSWVTIPMPPPEFNLQAWMATIDRLEAGPWSTLALTHGGQVQDCPAHLEQLRAAMEDQVAWIRSTMGQAHDKRRTGYAARLLEAGLGQGVDEALIHTHVSRGLLDMNLTGVDRAFQAP